MTAWTSPSLSYYRQADGTIAILDEKGNEIPAPPNMTYIPANGDSKMLDPWGNEVPEYIFPKQFFIHAAADGSMTAVDGLGVPLAIQPKMGHELDGPDYAVLPDGSKYVAPVYEFPDGFFIHAAADGSMTAVDGLGVPLAIQPKMGHELDGPDYAVLPDGSKYVAPVYEFPDGFFIHAAADGSMTAVDGLGVPLAIQPKMGHELDGPDYAVLPDGSKYVAPVYEFPDGFFIHAAADGSMTAVDGLGVPLAIQPKMGHELDGPDYAVLPDGSKYVAPVYEFPDGFFIHTAADGSMTAVDGLGVPLAIQPKMGHELDGPDYAVLPDGSKYVAPPLYPPAGETPEVWPPDPWPPESAKAVEDEDAGPEEVVGADSADDQDAKSDATDAVEQATQDEDVVDESMRNYSGVDLAEGEVLLDEDWSGDEPTAEVATDRASEDLLTAGLVDAAPGDAASVIPINIPDGSMPVGDEAVSATPIPLPSEPPLVGDEVVSATPIPLPSEPPLVGDDVVSVLPVPVPVPPAESDVDDGEIALDRKGGDRPVEYKLNSSPEEPAAEFQVEVIDEVQVEEVHREEVETRSIELEEPIIEYGDVPAEEEDVDDLDG